MSTFPGEFHINLPAYSLLLKDATGTICLKHEDDIFITLFDDNEIMETFIKRGGYAGKCEIVELKTFGELRDFIENPPSRGGNPPDRVMMNPVDHQPGTFHVYTRKQLLDSFPKKG